MRLAELFHPRRRTAEAGEHRAGEAGERPPLSPRPAPVPNWAGDEAETPEQQRARRRRQRVDDAIMEAERRGEFDNLRGKGKPIPAELLVSADDAWLAGKALANAGFLPPWLQLQHEIEDDLAQCRRLVERTERFPPLANRERPLTELRSRLDGIRAKTRRYNLMVPTMSLQRPLPNSDDLLQRLEQALARTPS
ncbi:MAG TPA: DUF1992 domain-containing protein [Chloroflexota bacterium]|nr:DUF1992 domain-containing protein [Chloroflexota bacterium]